MNKVSKKLQKFVSVFLVLALLAPMCFSAFAADEGKITLDKTAVKNTSISEFDGYGNASQFFDVTLSQSYEPSFQEEGKKEEPFDVLLILDRSASMQINQVDGEPLCKALESLLLDDNGAIDYILSKGAKIGVIDFNGGEDEKQYIYSYDFTNEKQVKYSRDLNLTGKASNMFSDDEKKIKSYIKKRLDTIPKFNAQTNMQGGLLFAQKIAECHQASNPDRKCEAVLMTDGYPSARFDENGACVSDGSGSYCSSKEYNITRTEGINLKNMDGVNFSVYGMFAGYKEGDNELGIVKNLFSLENPMEYTGKYTMLVKASSKKWKKSSPVCDRFYYFIKGDGKYKMNQTLNDLVEELGKMSKAKIVDTISADFQIIDSSVESLKNAGFEVNKNDDGTTTISNSNYKIKNTTQSITYTIKYTGNNSGVKYTNTNAILTILYNNQSKDYPMPVVGINPKTVNDSFEVEAGQDAHVIGNVSDNDIYRKFIPDDVLKDGGYTLGDYKIHLCDENGNEYAILDGVSLSINESTGDIEFSNSKAESLIFFYYVDATAKKDNADDINIKSRITNVTVTTTSDKSEPGDNSGTESKPEPGDNSGTESKPEPGDNSGTESKPEPGNNSGTESKPEPGNNFGTENKTESGNNFGTENKTELGNNSGTENKTESGNNSGTENKPMSKSGDTIEAVATGDSTSVVLISIVAILTLFSLAIILKKQEYNK